MSGGSLKPWQRRASPLVRQALLALVVLMVYASLYPFDWQGATVGPFDFVLAPLPRYLTWFDVIVNVLGYLPLGIAVVLALHPAWRGARAVFAAFAAGLVLSGAMESLQTYLPSRVSSNVDLATNALGALIGGAIAAPLASPLLDRGWLRHWRLAWFDRRASAALALLGLWPLAQAYPQQFLFGTGALMRQIWLSLDPGATGTLLGWVPGLAHLRRDVATLDPIAGQFAWEATVAASGTLVAGLLPTLSMRRSAPRLRLILALLSAGIAVKTAAAALQFSPAQAFDWVTPGAVLGLASGLVLLLLTARLPRGMRGGVALLALSVGLLLVNVLPVNPYYQMALDAWRQGQYLHFNVLARWIDLIWPYLALVYLLAMFDPTHRGHPRLPPDKP